MQTDEEIQAAIAARNEVLDKELADAIKARDDAEARVKAAREAKAAAPRLHVPRKYPGRKSKKLPEMGPIAEDVP